MNICPNCGFENFVHSRICPICDEPLNPNREELRSEKENGLPIKEFCYETSYSYAKTKIYPLLFLGGITFISLPVIFWPIPDWFTALWFGFVFIMVFMAFSYYWLYPELSIEDDRIKLITVFKEYTLKATQITHITEIDMMFMSNFLRVDLEKGPILFRINGLLYGAWGKPSFLINTQINHYNLLYSKLAEISGVKPKKVIV